MIVFWVESEAAKQELLSEESVVAVLHDSALQRAPRRSSCAVAGSPSSTRDELAEVVADAWLARAPKTKARRWLS